MTEQPRQPSPEEALASFRSSLEDLVVISEKLSPLCKTVEEMIGMTELAIKNDAQLRLLFNMVNTKR